VVRAYEILVQWKKRDWPTQPPLELACTPPCILPACISRSQRRRNPLPCLSHFCVTQVLAPPFFSLVPLTALPFFSFLSPKLLLFLAHTSLTHGDPISPLFLGSLIFLAPAAHDTQTAHPAHGHPTSLISLILFYAPHILALPVFLFGAELWWKGDLAEGTIGRANELQLLVNQEAQATTGCFRTTNLGALSMESGLRSAAAQLENRQRRSGLRLLSLPEGDQAREVVGALTEIGRRLKNALAYGGQTERTVLLEEPETLDAELLQEEEAEAKAAAEGTRPGLTMFTDGSRLDDKATGYAVVWRKGVAWVGVKMHMGHNQEAYNAECAALARAMELALWRNTTPERVTIFTDAQAAIRRMASNEPGPGQQYALQARNHIATLRRARPGIVIEIRWCPAHKGVAGNEKADEWAKAAAEQAGSHRPIPQSLANLKRENSEKKWAEARQWAGGRTSKKKYRMPESQKPDGAVANSTKRLTARFYQLKTGHCLTAQYLNWKRKRPTSQCWWCQYRTQAQDHLFKECPEWKPQQKILWAG